jgi:hypothetical protein
MVFNLGALLIELVVTVIVNLIIVAPVLWIAGRLLAGKQKAKFTDALWIVVIGSVVFYAFNFFLLDLLAGFSVILSYVVLLVIWLALVKHFFDCGWLKALVISVIAVIIAAIILFLLVLVLALIGIGAGLLPIGNQFMNF